jgi:drug/metabolite transporter (DMT)-like permease
VERRRPLGRHGHLRAHLLMLLATFCWAGNIIAGKDALRGFSALALATLRVEGAALLFAVAYLVRNRGRLPSFTRDEWKLMAGLALCGVTFNQLFFVGGLAYTSATHAGLIVTLGPVMVLALSSALKMEALTALKILGMVVSFSGVAVLTVSKPVPGNAAHWSGDLILLVASAVFAAYTILIKRASERWGTLTINALSYALGAVFMIPFGVYSVWTTEWSAVSVQAWWGLGFMILLGSIVPYLIFGVVMTELTPSRAAAFAYLQPILTTTFSLWLLSEKLTTKVIVGGALILLGVYLTEREGGEREPELAA